MDQLLSDGRILSNGLIVSFDESEILIEGKILCHNGLLVTVSKFIDILEERGPDSLVQTRYYAYNVSLPGRGTLFRHDNMHHPEWLAHLDDHHRHDFDLATGAETISWVGADGWPTLGEVLIEACFYPAMHS